MPVSELLMEGVNLMLIGMTVVFSFLGILVFSITVMSKIALALDAKTATASPAPTGGATSSGTPPEVMSVISAAVHRYRKSKNK